MCIRDRSAAGYETDDRHLGEPEEAGAGAAAQYSFHAGQSQRFDAANFPGRLCAERNRPAHPGAAGRDRPPGEREPDAGHELSLIHIYSLVREVYT